VDDGFTAVTAGFGRNDSNRDQARNGAFAEATRRRRETTIYGRAEVLEPEFAGFQAVGAFTAGGVRELFARDGLVAGLGGDVTLYAMRSALEASYGTEPVAVHVFLRVRPRSFTDRGR
jgi:hypothetical protein